MYFIVSPLLGIFKPILSEEDGHKNGTFMVWTVFISDKLNDFVVFGQLIRMRSVICVQDPRFVFYLI